MSNGQHMLWMLDEYETITGARYPGVLLVSLSVWEVPWDVLRQQAMGGLQLKRGT